MSEKFPQSTKPHSPSEAFTIESAREHRGVLDGEHGEAAAYAAQPWIDVALDSYNAKNKLDDSVSASDEPLSHLIGYAERRAHQAAKGERDATLTPIESEMLNVYKVEKAMVQAEAAVDFDTLSPRQIDEAGEIATRLRDEARAAGKAKEAEKWNRLARRAEDFQRLLFDNDLDEEDREALNRTLSPTANDAGFVLNMLGDDGESLHPDIRREYLNKARRDALNMSENTELYKLFAEVQSKEAASPETSHRTSQSEVDDMLKKQYERTAKEVTDYAEQIDPDVLQNAGFSDATRQVDAAMKNARIEGDTHAQAYLRGIKVAMNEYTEKWRNDEHDQLPPDIHALTRRRDLMRFLASTNPKEEEVTAQSSDTTQEKTDETHTEYNPDDTILPDNPIARGAFLEKYFKDSEHMEFTPENIKVMQDFLVLQTRHELGYIKRAFPGRRATGDMQLVFRMSALSMEELRKRRPDQMFAWKLVANNLKQPEMTYGQFKAMSLKDIVAATGIDITKYVEDYDEMVAFKPTEPREMPEKASFGG